MDGPSRLALETSNVINQICLPRNRDSPGQAAPTSDPFAETALAPVTSNVIRDIAFLLTTYPRNVHTVFYISQIDVRHLNGETAVHLYDFQFVAGIFR